MDWDLLLKCCKEIILPSPQRHTKVNLQRRNWHDNNRYLLYSTVLWSTQTHWTLQLEWVNMTPFSVSYEFVIISPFSTLSEKNIKGNTFKKVIFYIYITTNSMQEKWCIKERLRYINRIWQKTIFLLLYLFWFYYSKRCSLVCSELFGWVGGWVVFVVVLVTFLTWLFLISVV